MGHFNGNADGLSTDSIVGCAYFSRRVINGTQFIAMIFTNGDARSQEHVKLQTTGGLGLGTVPMGIIDESGRELRGAIFRGIHRFDIKGGSLTITNNQNPHLVGSFDVFGVNATNDTLQVRGSFFARCIEDPQLAPQTDNVINEPSRRALCNPLPPGQG